MVNERRDPQTRNTQHATRKHANTQTRKPANTQTRNTHTLIPLPHLSCKL
jgi:hypothetical protein